MRYQPRTEGVFLIAVIVWLHSEKLFVNTPDWIGRDEAITPKPRKRRNWTMVRETLVPDRVTVVILISRHQIQTFAERHSGRLNLPDGGWLIE